MCLLLVEVIVVGVDCVFTVVARLGEAAENGLAAVVVVVVAEMFEIPLPPSMFV